MSSSWSLRVQTKAITMIMEPLGLVFQPLASFASLYSQKQIKVCYTHKHTLTKKMSPQVLTKQAVKGHDQPSSKCFMFSNFPRMWTCLFWSSGPIWYSGGWQGEMTHNLSLDVTQQLLW